MAYKGDYCKNRSIFLILHIIYRGERNMNRKILLFLLILIIVIISIILFANEYFDNKKEDIKIPILLYHDFVTVVPETELDNYNYINTPESFEENIKVIIENGYTPISINELYEANNKKIKLPEKPILITFDDGYYSNYEYIYPILKKYKVKASIFIVTNNIGKEIDNIKYLSWNNCLEMQNSGLIEIYSHSTKHIFYNKVPVREIRDDVIESYKIIEENLGKKSLKVFAYPYGAYTNEAIRALKNNGIDMQIYDIGINNFKSFDKNYIKRINIPCEMTGKEIIEEIEKE